MTRLYADSDDERHRRWFLKIRSKSALGWKIEAIQIVEKDGTVSNSFRDLVFSDRVAHKSMRAYMGFLKFYTEGQYRNGPDAPDVPVR